MAGRPGGLGAEVLSAKRYITVLLRILVDPRGRVLQGELEDVSHPAPHRFRGRRGLLQALRTVLARHVAVDVAHGKDGAAPGDP
jgi:hypothetical protein